MKQKVLLIRLDKIGDLVCSLPVDQIIDEARYEVVWAVQKGLGSVVDLGQKKRTYIELDKNSSGVSAKKLSDFLKEFQPDVAISFQCPWWVNFELFKARVPVRAGVKSQWHSFLFLNQGLRQKRSQALQHEYDYNLDLVKKVLQTKLTSDLNYFKITPPSADDTLKKYNLSAKSYIVVHPGMMGSALNWPQSEYIKCIHRLIQQGHRIVITGTASDEAYLNEIKAEFLKNPNVTCLQSKLNLKELIEVLFFASYVIAPSTGVAHLAASVGTAIKGIYSPVQVHHPRRWAPRGPHVEVFMLPEVNAECF